MTDTNKVLDFTGKENQNWPVVLNILTASPSLEVYWDLYPQFIPL